MSDRPYLEILEEDDFLDLLLRFGPRVRLDGALAPTNWCLSPADPKSVARLAALLEWINDRNRRRKEAEEARKAKEAAEPH